MPAATSANEAAVRSYLLYLEDPSALRDEAEIAKRTKAVDESTDPIDKLKALAALTEASTIDEEPLREGFIAHAKAWAETQGVPLSAFQQMNVPDDVLSEAGFSLPAPGRRGRRGAGDGRQRARPVPVEEIKAHVLAQTGPFLLTEVTDSVGGSQATVRKAIDDLINTGDVDKLGPMPDYKGRGRAPIQYERRPTG